ncbi:MAG: hypothetical protein SV062_08235 [Thermodesulfobacteriota bacterium]|nr:hypothetical protein [Thermodesulfobacteriota bacterium]
MKKEGMQDKKNSVLSPSVGKLSSIAYRKIKKVKNQYCVLSVLREGNSIGEIIIEIVDSLDVDYQRKEILGSWSPEADPKQTGNIGIAGLVWFKSALEDFIRKDWDGYGLICDPICPKRKKVFGKTLEKLGFACGEEEEAFFYLNSLD